MSSVEVHTPTEPAMDELRSNLADILEFRMQLTYRISALLAQFSVRQPGHGARYRTIDL